MQQLRFIIYFTFFNFLAHCGYQMVKPRKCPTHPPFFSSRKLESGALKIAIGVLNPRIYIDLPLAQKLAWKKCLNLRLTVDIFPLWSTEKFFFLLFITTKKNRRSVRSLHSLFQARKRIQNYPLQFPIICQKDVDIKLKCPCTINKNLKR